MFTCTGPTSSTPLDRGQARRQASRIRVGGPGALEPAVVGEIAVELGRDESRLRQHLAATLHEEGQPRGRRLVEHDDGFGIHRAVLGRAERHDVDPGAPRHVRRRAIERRERIGEPRAVEVDQQAVAMRNVAERSHFFDGV